MALRRRPVTARITGAWKTLPAKPKPTSPTVSMTGECTRTAGLRPAARATRRSGFRPGRLTLDPPSTTPHPYLATTFSADCPCAASSRASRSGVRPCGKRLTRRSLLAKSGAGGVSRRSPTWENCPALSASYETSVTVSRARTTSAVSCTARSSPCALPPPRSASATATPSGRFAGANRSTLPPRLHPSVASTGPHTQLCLIGPSLSRARPGCERPLASLPHRSPCPERLQEVCVRGLHGARIVRSSEPIAADPGVLPLRQGCPPGVQLTAGPVERSGATIAQHHFRVQQAREQTVPQPDDQRNAVAACRRWGDEVDGIVQMGGRRPCQGLRIGPERRAVGEGKEETEVTARGVGDRGSRDQVTHGQRGAVWVRECGLLQGVADLQQLEMVDVFRFERLVAHFQADPAVPVRANPEPVDVTRLEGRAERVGEALRLERPRASAVGVDGRTVPEAIRG